MASLFNRRQALLCGCSILITGTAAGIVTSAAAQAIPDWRYCENCRVLFFSEKGAEFGSCPVAAGRRHRPAGFIFRLPNTGACLRRDTEKDQTNWRQCRNCASMFWSKADAKVQRCAGAKAGQTHFATSGGACYNLPINRAHGPKLNPETALAQGGWRYCGRCACMFFDGDLNNKGLCPAGGPHSAQGDFFVLPHDRPS